MTYYNRNLMELEFVLGKLDDWIIDLKDQTAEVNDVETFAKELYDIMYEFETIGQNVQKVLEYVEKAGEVDL